MTDDIDLGHLRSVFGGISHPLFGSEVTVYGEPGGPIHVNGSIFCRECRANAGRFSRIFERRSGQWVARHEDFRVVESFRRLGIATAHYRDCYIAYRSLGIELVEMYAVEFGPFVWPQFGFTFANEAQKKDAWERFSAAYYASIGEQPENEEADSEAYRLVFLEDASGQEIGSLALKSAAEAQPDRSLQLQLSLNDPAILRVLRMQGLLPKNG